MNKHANNFILILAMHVAHHSTHLSHLFLLCIS